MTRSRYHKRTKGTRAGLAQPPHESSLFLLPLLVDMVEGGHPDTSAAAFDVLINICVRMDKLFRAEGRPQAGRMVELWSDIQDELHRFLCELLCRLYYLDPSCDLSDVWQAALDAVIFFCTTHSSHGRGLGGKGGATAAPPLDAEPLDFSVRRLALVDPRVLVQLVHLRMASPALNRTADLYSVRLLVTRLYTDNAVLDRAALTSIGGIEKVLGIYLDCECTASAAMLFVVLFDFVTLVLMERGAFDVDRIPSLLELLFCCKAPWMFRKVRHTTMIPTKLSN
jgi:hypothetical protein|eukprot:COSAG01_NODE_5533_length_4202_cov_46.375091_2_plen_282_part_00